MNPTSRTILHGWRGFKLPALKYSGFHLAAVALLLAAAPAPAATVTVFAAASLTDALQALAATYEPQSGDKIVFNFAASGTLARQLGAGAPADLLFFADEAHADVLAHKGLLLPGSRRDVLGNALVLITPLDHPGVTSPAGLTNAACQRVALGEVKTVPCGAYAKTWLVTHGLWPAVAPKVIPCDNVRAVLAAVETGNVDAGMVYQTDALISHQVKVACTITGPSAPIITYPLARLKDSPEPAAAQKFAAFLESDAALTVFKKYGFLPPPAAAAP